LRQCCGPHPAWLRIQPINMNKPSWRVSISLEHLSTRHPLCPVPAAKRRRGREAPRLSMHCTAQRAQDARQERAVDQRRCREKERERRRVLRRTQHSVHADLTRTCTQCRTAWCPLLFWQRWLGSRIWTGHPGSRLRPGWSSTMRGSLGQIPWPLPTGVS